MPAKGLSIPDIPGYEVLGELGKGGMGVVYKARDVTLNRVVALKMILASSQAGPQERARFRTEAEAVARLQHPHIVQIYEVGELNGLPYCALEFVSGGSLAQRQQGNPLAAPAAAQLVEQLADGVQAVHACGILHRDLKPHNVLVTADGTPKITDFGLAKKLDEESGQTVSGAILGTPSYMAPEQAAGKIHELSPAADVYALGAILYELLVGRPPFKGATLFETLQQVRTEEPVPPRRLQPTVPRDLETICLKCLCKEPSQRYAGARELAADLRRFRAREPILARSPGAAERLWRWCRRNPGVAALTSAVAGLLLTVAVVSTLASFQLKAANQQEQASRLRAEENLQVALDAVTAFLQQATDLQLEQQWIAARRVLDQALPLCERLAGDHPDAFAPRARLSMAYFQFGRLHQVTRQPEQARTFYVKALTAYGPSRVDPTQGPIGPELLVRIQMNLGLLDATPGLSSLPGNLANRERAEGHYREALQLLEALDRQYPRAPQYHLLMGETHHQLGVLSRGGGHYDEALEHMGKALSLVEPLASAHKEVVEYRFRLGNMLHAQGFTLVLQNRLIEARIPYEKAAAILQPLALEHPAPDHQNELSALTYDRACLEALAAAAVLRDSHLAPAERQLQSEPYCRAALEHLQQAWSAGFKHYPGALKLIRTDDKDLEALRGREEFKNLVVNFEKELGTK